MKDEVYRCPLQVCGFEGYEEVLTEPVFEMVKTCMFGVPIDKRDPKGQRRYEEKWELGEVRVEKVLPRGLPKGKYERYEFGYMLQGKYHTVDPGDVLFTFYLRESAKLRAKRRSDHIKKLNARRRKKKVEGDTVPQIVQQFYQESFSIPMSLLINYYGWICRHGEYYYEYKNTGMRVEVDDEGYAVGLVEGVTPVGAADIDPNDYKEFLAWKEFKAQQEKGDESSSD